LIWGGPCRLRAAGHRASPFPSPSRRIVGAVESSRMSTTKTFVTLSDLWRMPEDGFRYELVAGELVKKTPAGWKHGYLAMRLGSLLDQHVRAGHLGVVCAAETGFRLSSDPDTVRAPDVSFVAASRIPKDGLPDTFCPFAPDLAVEVVSPNDRFQEVLAKVDDYLKAGTNVVWVVDPKTETVLVYVSGPEANLRLQTGDVLRGEPVLPGFAVGLNELFAENS